MGFEALKDKLTKLSADTKTSVQKMSESYQVNSKLAEEKKNLDTLFAQIGAAVAEKFADSPLEGFEEQFAAIKNARDLIAGLEEQAQKLKGAPVCPDCGKQAGKGEKFCSACGAKLPEWEEESAQPEAPEADETAAQTVEEAEAPADADAPAEEAQAAGETQAEADDAVEQVKKDALEVGKEVGDIVNGAADKARGFFSSVADKAGAFVQGVKSQIATEAEKAKEAAAQAAADAEEAAEDAEESLDQVGEGAVADAQAAAQDVAEAVADAAAQAGESVSEAAETVAEEARGDFQGMDEKTE